MIVNILDESYFAINTMFSAVKLTDLRKYGLTSLMVKNAKDEVDKRMDSFCNYGIPDRLVICYDSSPYIKKDWYPDYKGGRPPRTLDEETLLSEVRGHIIECYSDRVTLLSQCGLEADDLIHSVVKEGVKKNAQNEFNVFSRDSDLMVLFGESENLEFKWFGSAAQTTRGGNIPKNIPEEILKWLLHTKKYNDITKHFALSGGHNNLKRVLPTANIVMLLRDGGLEEFMDVHSEKRKQYEFNLKLTTFLEGEVEEVFS
jgi:5'-3' exonuclease